MGKVHCRGDSCLGVAAAAVHQGHHRVQVLWGGDRAGGGLRVCDKGALLWGQPPWCRHSGGAPGT
jgi:hypothetical protein